eukprot:587127_1
MSDSGRSVSDGNELNLRSIPPPFACSDVTMDEFKNIDDDIDCKGLNLGADLSAQEKIVLREKVIIVGESCVGKSSLIKSFVGKGSFNYDAQATKYLMTTRLDMQIVTVENGNVDVDLFLYDFGGQSIFHQREMAKEYQKDATYILCVYDISSRTSLQSISTWLASVRSVVGQKIPAILVANKIDAIYIYIYIYSSIIFYTELGRRVLSI